MGDALFDLEHVLRSRREKLTIQEANVLLAWRAQAMRDFTVGFGGGSVVSWLATSRLSNMFRLNITLAAAAACGFWRFGRSVESCVDRVLSLEGSRIQKELATIMLNKYSNEPWVLQRLSKHFYREAVLDDTSVDKAIFRWRFRNTCGDRVDHSQDMAYGEETDSNKNAIKKTAVEQNQVYVKAANIMVEDPLNIMFWVPGSAEDNPHINASSISPDRQTRREKRSRRRHRQHHQEDSEI